VKRVNSNPAGDGAARRLLQAGKDAIWQTVHIADRRCHRKR
jgi:hypothetical protein